MQHNLEKKQRSTLDEPYFTLCLVVNVKGVDFQNEPVKPDTKTYVDTEAKSIFGLARFGENNVGETSCKTGIDAFVGSQRVIEPETGMNCHIRQNEHKTDSFAEIFWFKEQNECFFRQIYLYLKIEEINSLKTHINSGFKTAHFTLFTTLEEQNNYPLLDADETTRSSVVHSHYISHSTSRKFESFEFFLQEQAQRQRQNKIHMSARISKLYFQDEVGNADYPDFF